MTGDVVVLKLGGSVLTEKDRPETLDERALERTADAIASALAEGAVGRLVVVHGGGSFGHHHASAHGLSTTEGTHDASAIWATHGAMQTLDDAVVEALLERGVPAIPVHPLSVGHRDETGALTLPTGAFETALGEGFVPVTHGDGVLQAGEGVTILSGDELVVHLGRDLDADRIGVCSTVPGVLDEDGEVLERVTDYEDVAPMLGESEATDVSGGMAGKIRELCALEAPAAVFGLDDLEAFLSGEASGTVVE